MLYKINNDDNLLIYQQMTNITTCDDDINKLVKEIIYFLNIY